MIENIESHFCGESAWSCNYCGELVLADEDQMQDHLESCEEYQKKQDPFWRMKKMTDKIFITDEEFKEKSSEIAEKEHHESCEFECCGEHSDYFDEDHKKCPKCGMTEEIQDNHNDQVWAIIDSAEFELSEKYSIMWKHEDPEDCDHQDYMEEVGKMQSNNLEGVYNIPFFCPNCNHFVKEVYNYEGVKIA